MTFFNFSQKVCNYKLAQIKLDLILTFTLYMSICFQMFLEEQESSRKIFILIYACHFARHTLMRKGSWNVETRFGQNKRLLPCKLKTFKCGVVNSCWHKKMMAKLLGTLRKTWQPQKKSLMAILIASEHPAELLIKAATLRVQNTALRSFSLCTPRMN